MKKIDGFEAVEEVLSNDNLEPGPHVVEIKKVEDNVDREYLRVEFDISRGDHKGKFTDMEKNTGKWPNMGVLYKSYKPTALPYFKRFIVAVEKSNDNFKFDFDEQKLVGKYFVANYGIEEWLDGNEIRESLKPVEARSLQALKEKNIEVPKPKLIERTEKTNEKIEIQDDDLPF